MSLAVQKALALALVLALVLAQQPPPMPMHPPILCFQCIQWPLYYLVSHPQLRQISPSTEEKRSKVVIPLNTIFTTKCLSDFWYLLTLYRT